MKKISALMIMGAVMMFLAGAMSAIMWVFPAGFAEHTSGEEALLVNLAKGPVAAGIGIFAAVYIIIAVCMIGGMMTILRERRMMAIK